MTARILLVEDEKPLVDAITYALQREGYTVLVAFDGQAALQMAEGEQPDLILLDLLLPKLGGLELCRILRRRSDVPIIMLTAKAGEADRVVGLELGADDYITKPFSMRELLARIRAVLRRSQAKSETPAPAVLEDVGLRLDLLRREASLHGQPLNLTTREFDLLAFLMGHPGIVFSRTDLLEKVWGTLNVGPETVSVHIHWLRQKIEEDPERPQRLLTVRGIGYKYRG